MSNEHSSKNRELVFSEQKILNHLERDFSDKQKTSEHIPGENECIILDIEPTAPNLSIISQIAVDNGDKTNETRNVKSKIAIDEVKESYI